MACKPIGLVMWAMSYRAVAAASVAGRGWVMLVAGLGLLASLNPLPAGTISLAWEPSAAADVVGYRVRYGYTSHRYPNSVWAGDATSITLSNLAVRKSYYFVVTAVGAGGVESAPSNEAMVYLPDPFALVQGTYNGLFYETNELDPAAVGAFTLTTTSSGSYSGRLLQGTSSVSFSGRLNGNCQATNRIARRSARSLVLTFQLGDGQISGSLSDGTWTTQLAGDRVVFDARTHPAPWTGAYTLVLPSQDDPASPAGDGFGAVRLAASGVVSFTGTLGDGTRITQSASVSKNGWWPFYCAPYSGRGLVVSWLTFAGEPGDELAGEAAWIRPADARARFYPLGFTNQCPVLASRYVAPASPTDRVIGLTNGSVTFSGGGLASDFTNSILLGANNRVTNLSSNRLSLSFSSSSGTFRGTVTEPATRKSRSFAGAVLQNRAVGCGLLTGTNETSGVSVGP
jgi:hypothetical protein